MKCRFLYLLLATWLVTSCTSRYATVKSRLETSLYENDIEKANELIDNNKVYQKDRNTILYHMEKGKLLFLQGKHKESNSHFEKADLLIETFRHTPDNQVLSYLVNDLMQDYRPKDFEVLALYYYKALNYLALGEYNDALVEARRMNLYLHTLNHGKSQNQNRFVNDAFTNNLMGLIYEQAGDINNAFIAYRNAVDLYLSYQSDEENLYMNVELPKQLKIDLLRMARANKFRGEFERYNAIFQITEDELQHKDVLVFWESGLAPILGYENVSFALHPTMVDGKKSLQFINDNFQQPFSVAISENQWETLSGLGFIRINIPTYYPRYPDYRHAVLSVGEETMALELAEDYFSIAKRVQKSNLATNIGKTLLRVALKEAAKISVVAALNDIEKSEEEEEKEKEKEVKVNNENEEPENTVIKLPEAVRKEEIEKQEPDLNTAATIAGLLFTAYNYASEQADTRQWVSLPSKVYYTRIERKRLNKPISLKLSDGFQVSSETIAYEPHKGNNQAFIYFSSY